MIIWFNGAFINEDQARIAVTDRGLTLADGVFDTALAVDGTMIDAATHFERLRDHAAVIGMSIDTAQYAVMAKNLLQRNEFTTGRHAIRTTITRGAGARGLLPPPQPQPTIIMRASPAPPAPDPEQIVKLIVSSVRRNEGSPLSWIKALGYGDNQMALAEAQKHGADDAIMLNNAGHVACACAANVFVKIGDQWATPPIEDGAMNGITRAHLLAEGFGIERRVTAAELAGAEGVILCNSIMGARAGKLI